MSHFDLSVTCQSSIFFEDLKLAIIEKTTDLSKTNYLLTRFTGLPIAICFSLLDIAKIVSSVGEALIKGLANILGALFFNNCHFLQGIKQIFLHTPIHVLKVIGLPITLVTNFLVTPIILLRNPKKGLASLQQNSYRMKTIFTDSSKKIDFTKIISAEKSTFLLIKHAYLILKPI